MYYKILKSVIFIVTLLVSNSVVGQGIDFSKISVSEVEVYEKSKNSTPKDTLDDFGILKNPHFDLETLVQTKALIFKRNDDEFDPQLHIWYHFNKDWTELKGRSYHWGLYNPKFKAKGNEKWLKKLSKNEKGFKEKYNSLEQKLKSELGEPIKKKTIADNENKFIENMFWEDDEKIVGLAISFDRKIKEIPGIGIFAKFKIEVMITYK
ncbi:hypothetical protein [Marinifilum caeruleilacunae]|uniref:DUF3298 domain-containing protein n=1 Tax=Marinifilum caeruleilacunae TaxID=2499076 RepID=A0ABX1WUD6_9BACT|nr:hypothetical protein [Marinifilum caeruleilacunae]NOU59632.1 hypothetical protein [Marinifilum caeruleilacunae]